MEKVHPWCGQPSDRGWLKNRTDSPLWPGALQLWSISIRWSLWHPTVRRWIQPSVGDVWCIPRPGQATGDNSFPCRWSRLAETASGITVNGSYLLLVCGTVFLMNWDHLTLLWLRSETNWRRYYLTCSCFFSAFVASCESALYKWA